MTNVCCKVVCDFCGRVELSGIDGKTHRRCPGNTAEPLKPKRGLLLDAEAMVYIATHRPRTEGTNADGFYYVHAARPMTVLQREPRDHDRGTWRKDLA